jgi:hypothetical protein
MIVRTLFAALAEFLDTLEAEHEVIACPTASVQLRFSTGT